MGSDTLRIVALGRGTGQASAPLRPAAALAVRFLMGLIVLGAATGCVGSIRLGHPAYAAFKLLLLIVPTVGALIALRRPANPMGWLLLVSGSAVVVSALVEDDRFAILGPGSPSGFAALVAGVMWPLTFPLMGVSLYWFPGGDVPSPRWRPLAFGGVLVVAAMVFGQAITPWPAGEESGPKNPLAVASVSRWYPFPLLFPAQLFLVAAALASMPVRYWHASPVERQQVRWVLWACIVSLVSIAGVLALSAFTDVPGWVDGLAAAPVVVLIPGCIGIAILRDQLLNIDVLLNRTLLYLSFTGAILGIYIGTVVAATMAFDPHSWVSPALAGLLVAFVFHPLRTYAQRMADRRLFGDRSQPLRVLERVSASVPMTATRYEELAAAIASSLRLHFVAIEIDGLAGITETATRVSQGEIRSAPLVEFPLARGNVELGRLIVAARSQSEPFGANDSALLTAIAAQLAVAADSERLAGELQRSRERIVRAAEEERRRLRRDLHDDLGARLTAVGYGIAAAAHALPAKSKDEALVDARVTLERTQQEVTDAVSELRRVIDDLRPGALDELGLPTALVAAAQHTLDRAGIALHSSAPPGSRRGRTLGAATESALYRIGVEAVTNVARHSGAANCWLELSFSDTDSVVRLVIADDGQGIPTTEDGGPNPHERAVGLISMRERAEELGGVLQIHPRQAGGTVVEARLPWARDS